MLTAPLSLVYGEGHVDMEPPSPPGLGARDKRFHVIGDELRRA